MKQLEEKLVCPICKAEKVFLGIHLRRVHGILPDEAKQLFGLDSLTASAYRESRKGEGNSFYGKHHTDESKDQMIMNRDGRHYVEWVPPLCKANCGRRVKTPGFEYCHTCAMRIKNSGENNASKRPEVKAKIKANHPANNGKDAGRTARISKAKTGKSRPDMVGDKNPAKRPEVRRKIALAVGPISKQRWQDPEFVRKQVQARSKPKNKFETNVESILNELCSGEYLFVGDGKFFIGTKNPDFVNVGQKKIIEAYGEYWHKPEEEQQRIDLFAQQGYQTLIIWDYELEDIDKLKKKILEFHVGKRLNDYNQSISNEMMG